MLGTLERHGEARCWSRRAFNTTTPTAAAAAACPQAELTAVNEQMKSSHTMLPPRWGEYTQRKEASNIHLAHVSFQPS